MTSSSAVEKIEQPATESRELTPMGMLEIAVNRGADVGQLEKLLALQERWEANEARKAFVAALSAFKAEPPTVTKNKSANYGGGKAQYEYATLPQVVNVIAPALSKHGLSHRFSMQQSEGQIAVTCTLTHVMGHSETVTLSAPADTTGSKNAIQSIGSTVSYLERYTLLAITGLAAEGQDDDAGGIVVMIDEEQKKKLQDGLKTVNADTSKFLAHFGIDYIDMLPAREFDRAIRMIDAKRRAK